MPFFTKENAAAMGRLGGAARQAAIPSPTQRFARAVLSAPGDGCWEWQRARNHRGYGLMYYEGRLQPAHRVAWQLYFGPIPEGMQVLHRCDNPPCVRLLHLRLGTISDNARDRVQKGRHVNVLKRQRRR